MLCEACFNMKHHLIWVAADDEKRLKTIVFKYTGVFQIENLIGRLMLKIVSPSRIF